jgi:RHS repeat-associated protein
MVNGTNHHGEESIYHYNALGVLTRRNDTDFVLDYTSFVPTTLMEFSNNLTQRHVYGSAGFGLSRISTTLTSAPLTSNPLTSTFYIQNDRLGSGRFATDTTGNRVAHTHLDEWGNILNQEKPTFAGSEVNILNTFTNHTYDEVLGLYYAQARFYAPNHRRFISADPHWNHTNRTNSLDAIQQAGNLYSYTINNPLRFVDPAGLRLRIVGTEEQIRRILNELNRLTRDTLIIGNKELQSEGRRSNPNIYMAEVNIEQRVNINEGEEFLLFSMVNGELRYYNIFNYYMHNGLIYPPYTRSQNSGTNLLRDIIGDRRNTTTIHFKRGEDGIATYRLGMAHRHYLGSDADIFIDTSRTVSVWVVDPVTGLARRDVMPTYIVLGHELIHALGYMGGRRLVGEEEFSHTNRRGLLETNTISTEELATIGLIDGKDITENDLRRENGLPLRATYKK